MVKKLDIGDEVIITFSWLLKLLILNAILLSIAERNFFLIFSACVVLIISFIPAIIERKWKLFLPIEVDFIVTLFLYLHFILGEIGEYYIKYWWFDILLHASSGILFGLLGFIIGYVFFYTKKIKAAPSFLILMTISVSLATGVLWEIFEYMMDQTFGFNMQKSGLTDTMWDLISNAIGAFIISLFGYLYIKFQPPGFIRRFLRKMLEFNEWLHKEP